MKIDVTMPKLSLSIDEGVVADWYVCIGQVVTEGTALAAIETDKIAADLECPDEGRLIEILVEAGETARVGDVLARLEKESLMPTATPIWGR